MHIFGMQKLAIGFKRSREDETVIPTQLITGFDIQSAECQFFEKRLIFSQ